ncbi:hypothetical protein PV08_03340 [Exophiala spinifera]|uniref:Uncharacterized protein n=1 Tax=Exophiala spinifera TaxID=91928 RepID=A0A0D2BKH0_9EURO|nr:uncharacterized protein PV08_03340 [Exophiala spinifera]KIW19050.1 hypothetical protein PV08_03340 [Exophiala spinifera]
MDKVKAVLHSNKQDPDGSTSVGPTGRMTGQGSHFPKAEDTTSFAGVPGSATKQSGQLNPDDEIGTAAIGTTSTYSSHHLAKGDPVGNVIDSHSADPTTYKTPEHMYGSSSIGVPEGAAGTAASLAFNKDRQHSTSQIPGAFPKDESSPQDSTRAASAATSGFAGSGATRDPYGSRGLEAASGGAAGTGGSSALGQGISAATAGAAAANTSSHQTTHDVTTITPSGLTSTSSPADRFAGYGATEEVKVPDEAAHNQTSSSDPAATGSSQAGAFGKILGAMGLGAAAGGATAAGREDAKPDIVAGTPEQPTTTTGLTSYTAPTESGPSAENSQPPSYPRKESIPTSAYPAGKDSPAPINPPVGGTAAAASEPEHTYYTGRNEGFAVAGIGAGALGTHELGKHRSEPGQINEYNIGTGVQSTAPAAPYAPATSTRTEQGMDQSQTLATGYNDSTPERDSKGYGKTAVTAGLGAGAATAGSYALGHEKNKPETGDFRAEKPYTSTESATEPSTTTSQLPVREKDDGPATSSASAEYPSGRTQATEDGHTARNVALAGAAGAGAGAYGVHEYNKHHTEEDPTLGRQAPATRTKNTPVTAYSQNTQEKTTRTDPRTDSDQDKSRTSRDAALAGTATAGAGAGAYGIHEHDKPRVDQDSSAGRQSATTSSNDPSTAVNDTKATPVATSSGPTSQKATKGVPTAAEEEKSHTGHNTALAGAAGAGAGAGAYSAHEYNKHEGEEDAAQAEARRQKDLAEQEAARQKQFEKDQKAAEKLAHKEEKQHQKEEKKRQKELEKEEKRHQKEIEKEDKHHDKELAAAEVERERQVKKENQSRAEAVEAETAQRHKEDTAAAAVGGTAAVAAYGAHEHDQNTDAQKHHEQESLGKQSAGSGRPAVVTDESGHNVLHKDPPKEKKPNIFKRIFKRRKNKDTGEDEEYSTDEEDLSHDAPDAGVVGAGGGASATDADAARYERRSTTSTSTGGHHRKSYEEQSGGLQKPSYNPFSKQSSTSATT